MPRTFLAIALACGIAGSASRAAAQGSDGASPAAVDAARADFAEGQSHFRAKRWNDALRSFERSFAQVSSPNVGLMIARSLRELGRSADAAEAFSAAESEARKRVTRGETKYAETADAAANEGKAVRAGLGTIRVHIAGAAGAALTIDRRSLAVSKEGDASLLHEPGSVPVTVRSADGATQRQTAIVTAGGIEQLEFVVAEPKSAPSLATKAVPSAEERDVHGEGRLPEWFWPSAIAAGGLTLAGTGVGIGFGAVSSAQYDDLADRCGRVGCSSAQDRAQAETGERNQTIANVGFGVAVVGAIVTGVVLFLGLTSDRRPGTL